MGKYGADYLIFSELDLDAAPAILAWPRMPQPIDGEYESFPEDSLVVRSLNGEFDSGGGLKRVYPEEPSPEGGYPEANSNWATLAPVAHLVFCWYNLYT